MDRRDRVNPVRVVGPETSCLRREPGDDPAGVAAHAVQARGGKAPLLFQADVGQARMDGRDPVAVERLTAWAKGTEQAR